MTQERSASIGSGHRGKAVLAGVLCAAVLLAFVPVALEALNTSLGFRDRSPASSRTGFSVRGIFVPSSVSLHPDPAGTQK